MPPKEAQPLKVYEESLKLIKDKKYSEAYEKLKSIKSRYSLASVKIAELFVDEKIPFEDKYDDKNHAALSTLEKAGGAKSKEYYNQLRALIDKKAWLSEESDLSEKEKGVAHYFYAKTHLEADKVNKHFYLYDLFLSCFLGYQSAIEEFEQYITKPVAEVEQGLAKLYLAMHDKNIDSLNDQQKLIFLLGLQKLAEKIEKFESHIINREDKEDSKQILRGYTRRNIQERITACYQSVVENFSPTNDYKILQAAITWIPTQTDSENNQDVVNSIKRFYFNNCENNEETVNLAGTLIDYSLKTKDDEEAFNIAQKVYEFACFWQGKFSELHQKIENLYRDLHREEELTRFNELKNDKGDGQDRYEQAKELLTQPEQQNLNFQDIFRKLAFAAKRKNIQAMRDLRKASFHEEELLKDLSTEQIRRKIYATLELSVVLKNVGELKPKPKSVAAAISSITTHPFTYYNSFGPDQLLAIVLRAYENLLKKQDPQSYAEVAQCYYAGSSPYPKNNSLARAYFKKAIDLNYEDDEMLYSYARMCFEAEGGIFDLLEAKKYISKLNLSQVGVKENYLAGEIAYLQFLDAQHQQNQDNINLFAIEAIQYFKLTAEKGCRQSQLGLFILAESTGLDLELNTYLQEKAWSTPQGLERESFSFETAAADLQLNPPDLRKMRFFAEHEEHQKQQEAVDALHDFYKNKPNGILNLISSLCYEARRHAWDSSVCMILRDAISQLDNKFEDYNKSRFEKYLKNKEKEKGDYFDEHLSEDSDLETEQTYQGMTHHVTTDYEAAQQLIDKINTKGLIKELKALKNKVVNDDANYRDLVGKYKSLFSHLDSPSATTAKTNDTRVLEDLQTLNYYSSKNQLSKALHLITTSFCVAQVRGVEFRTTSWNQVQRRKMRRLVTDKNHPLHNKALYSLAIWRHAGVTDFTDDSELTQHKLQQSARFVRMRLQQLNHLAAHEKEDLPDELKVMANRSFETRLEQVQQLYSSNKDKFELYLQWQIQISDEDYIAETGYTNPFVNACNPFVSTGDIISPHPGKYTYGNKAYAGHVDERLRPQHDKDGRAHRPYCGLEYLTIHPLEDFAYGQSNYVPAMNTKGLLELENNIIYEREQTFPALISADRVKFIHAAKFPSFTEKGYLKTYLYQYGLTKDLYDHFKELILKYPPHSYQRRLTQLLLGEYISAYQTHYLAREAVKHVNKPDKNLVLLYRDRYGNFSLRPMLEVDANPHGDSHHSILRKLHTHEIRRVTRSANLENTENDADDEQDNLLVTMEEEETRSNESVTQLNGTLQTYSATFPPTASSSRARSRDAESSDEENVSKERRL